MASNKAYKEIYITKDVARFSFIWYENSGTIANCFRNSNTVEKKITEKNMILSGFQKQNSFILWFQRFVILSSAPCISLKLINYSTKAYSQQRHDKSMNANSKC